MRLIKTKPRFRCDFCSRVSTEAPMKRHERICWRNPNRQCDMCGNKSWIWVGEEVDGVGGKEPCYYCNQYDPTKLPESESSEWIKELKG